MGRRFKCQFTLQDGRQVGATPKPRGDVLRAKFVRPNGTYAEVSTGVPVPKGWEPGDNPPADWHTATAKAIVQAWKGDMPADLRRATWDEAEAALMRLAIRPRTQRTYLDAVAHLRTSVAAKGPHEITPQIATAYITDYRLTPFRRGHASDAKERMRGPETVLNRIRNLTIVWSNLADLGFVVTNPWQSVKRPKLQKRLPNIPSEEVFGHLMTWIGGRYRDWPLLLGFVNLKMLTGRRLMDLCLVRSDQIKGDVLTISPDQDKTGQELQFPLPADLAAVLHGIKGPTFLWEKYAVESRTYNPGPRNIKVFAPRSMYHAVYAIFRKYNKENPDSKVKTHDLRKRAITLTAMATGNVDATAAAMGIDPQTARLHYLDAKKAFSGADLMRKMAGVLLPGR